MLVRGCWFSPGAPASSTTTIGHHDITEILLKVALKHQKSIMWNQCPSPLMLWVRIPLMRGVLYTTLRNNVCQWLTTDLWFSPGTPVSSTNKTDFHNITEILLKVVLNTITLSLCSGHNMQVPYMYMYVEQSTLDKHWFKKYHGENTFKKTIWNGWNVICYVLFCVLILQFFYKFGTVGWTQYKIICTHHGTGEKILGKLCISICLFLSCIQINLIFRDKVCTV